MLAMDSNLICFIWDCMTSNVNYHFFINIFPHWASSLPPSCQLLPAVLGSESILHCRVQCYQNSLLFNTLLCICGVKLRVYHLQAQHNNSPGKQSKQVHILNPGLSLLGFLLKSSLLVTYWVPTCPSGGPCGVMTVMDSGVSQTPGHSLPLQWGYGVIKCETEKERTRRCLKWSEVKWRRCLVSNKSAFWKLSHL